MTLKEMLEQLTGEIGVAMPKQDADKFYLLKINPTLSLRLFDLKPGFSLFSQIVECPLKKKEDLFIHLMRANFLGQGTGGGRLGLDQNEKLLTLSHGFPYEMNYKSFKESVEDFVNYVVYWRDFVAQFEKE
jgi:hypothetical protein